MGSLGYDTATDEVIVKTSAGWAPVGGGGGGITSITTATPSVLSIMNPSGPVANIDVVSLPPYDALRNLPSTPDAFDDEFVDGSPDGTTRNIEIYNLSTGTVLTWAGPVDLTATPLVGTYRASLYASRWLIQPPTSSGTEFLYISKPCTNASFRYAFRMSRGMAANGTGNRKMILAIQDQATPPYFTGNFLQIGLDSLGGNTGWRVQQASSAGYNDVIAFGGNGAGIACPWEVPSVYVYDRGGAQGDINSLYYDVGFPITFTGHASNTATWTRVGVALQFATGSVVQNKDSLLSIDYMRRMPYLNEFV